MKTQKPRISFDKEFLHELACMESLASPGSNVQFAADEGKLVVTFYGGETQSRRSFDFPDKSVFTFSMKSTDILGILKSFGNGLIVVGDGHIEVKSGNTKMSRQVEGNPAPPFFPSFEGRTMQELPSSVFPVAYYTSYATDSKGIRPVLERVNIMLRSGEASIYSCDGYRAALATIPLSYEGDTVEYLLQAKLLQQFSELTKGENGKAIKIAKGMRHYLFLVGDIQVATSQLSDVGFREQTEKATINAMNAEGMNVCINTSALKQYLNRTKLIASSVLGQPLVFRIDVSKSEMFAVFKTQIGSIEDTLPVTIENSRANMPNIFRIGFNPSYLTAVCNKVYGDSFTMKVTGPLNPAIISEESDGVQYTHLVLPVNIRTEPEVEKAPEVVAVAIPASVPAGVTAEDFM